MAAENSPLLVAPQIAVDGELYASYRSVPSTDISESDRLIPSKPQVDAEKAAFYASDCQVLPDLRPTMLDLEQLDSYEHAMHEYKDQLRSSGHEPDLVQAYIWRINEKIAKNRMLRAGAEGDMRAFGHYNHFVYGAPGRDIFAAVADTFASHAENAQVRANRAVGMAAEDVLSLMDEHRGDKTILEPKPEVFRAVREEFYRPGGHYALLLAGVALPAEGLITQEIGDPILLKVLRNMGAKHRIVDARGNTWSVNNTREELRRPAGYNLPIERFMGLPVGHELGHYIESANGKRSALKLLGIGMDRYEPGSEGYGLVHEQIAYPDFNSFARTERWQTVLRRHFATAIALGAAGIEKTFPDTYRCINAVDRLYQAEKTPDDPEGAMHRAHEKTWALMNQTHKGTDGTAGAVYRRYMLYLEGNRAVWNAEADQPGLILEAKKGKLDISNPRHVALLSKYNVLSPAVA